MTDREHIKQQLQEKLLAYQQLLAGSEVLLEQNTLYWVKKLLLSLLRTLSARRIELLLTAKFEEAMKWLTNWHEELTGETPF